MPNLQEAKAIDFSLKVMTYGISVRNPIMGREEKIWKALSSSSRQGLQRVGVRSLSSNHEHFMVAILMLRNPIDGKHQHLCTISSSNIWFREKQISHELLNYMTRQGIPITSPARF